jgi:hypothetical protein
MASQNFVTTIEKNHELDNELVDGMLGNFECTTLLLAFSVVLHLMLLLLIDPQLYIPTTRNM